MAQQILVVAPHMDDEVLGCGATICRHVKKGDRVTVLIVANRAYGHRYDEELIQKEKECTQAAQKVLGYQDLIFLDLPDECLDQSQIEIIKAMEAVLSGAEPDVVYLPNRGDNNQDHRSVFTAARIVFRSHSADKTPALRVYEVPSSTDVVPCFSEFNFQANLYVDVTEYLSLKIRAMACYEKESRVYPHPRSPEGIEVSAKKRGIEVGLSAAEAFMVIRDIWR